MHVRHTLKLTHITHPLISAFTDTLPNLSAKWYVPISVHSGKLYKKATINENRMKKTGYLLQKIVKLQYILQHRGNGSGCLSRRTLGSSSSCSRARQSSWRLTLISCYRRDRRLQGRCAQNNQKSSSPHLPLAAEPGVWPCSPWAGGRCRRCPGARWTRRSCGCPAPAPPSSPPSSGSGRPARGRTDCPCSVHRAAPLQLRSYWHVWGD